MTDSNLLSGARAHSPSLRQQTHPKDEAGKGREGKQRMLGDADKEYAEQVLLPLQPKPNVYLSGLPNRSDTSQLLNTLIAW